MNIYVNYVVKCKLNYIYLSGIQEAKKNDLNVHRYNLQ